MPFLNGHKWKVSDMGWMGKIVGGTIGLALGGPLGAIAGAAFGHFFDKSSELTYEGGQWERLNRHEDAQMTFFVAAFSMLAKLVHASGRVTRDEIANPQNLAMFLDVNDHRYQDGSTRTMHFGVATLISHLSQFMSLQPGDVISTGTPPGVGMGQSPETYLKPGDRMHLGIEGLGTQTQSTVLG